MDFSDIRHLRLLNQLITRPISGTPAQVVAHFGAMQAQDYYMAKWAIGLRLVYSVDQEVEAAIQSGQILRTHVLRPTWHFVTPEDIRWLLKLTAPHVHHKTERRRRELDLDEKVLAAACKAFEKALGNGSELTRKQLAGQLAQAGIAASEQRLAYMVMYAELEGVICSGARVGHQFTYALLDRKAPAARPYNRDAALAALADRYFGSRGPATVQDFSWWSGLPMAEARAGAALLDSSFVTEQVSGKTCIFRQTNPPLQPDGPAARTPVPQKPDGWFQERDTFLMPDYDEYVIGYRGREAVAPELGAYDLNSYNHWLILSGRIQGSWQFANPRKTDIALESTVPVEPDARQKLDAARERFLSFWRT